MRPRAPIVISAMAAAAALLVIALGWGLPAPSHPAQDSRDGTLAAARTGAPNAPAAAQARSVELQPALQLARDTVRQEFTPTSTPTPTPTPSPPPTPSPTPQPTASPPPRVTTPTGNPITPPIFEPAGTMTPVPTTAPTTVPTTLPTTAPATAAPTLPPTQTPTVTRTATPTSTSTPSGNPITPAQQQSAGVQCGSTNYVSGANPLTPGQGTQLTVRCDVRNTLNQTLDYSHTVTFELGAEVVGVSATTSTGAATISSSQVTWGGFVLAPGQSASITLTMDVVPATSSVGRPVTLITSTHTTATGLSGGFVDVTGRAVDTAGGARLLSGGFVLAGGPPAAGVARNPGVAPVPAASVSTLPRTGAGAGAAAAERRGLLLGLLLAALTATLALAPAFARLHQRRR